MVKTYIVLSNKDWHDPLFSFLKSKFSSDHWHRMKTKEEFSIEAIDALMPDKIFIPHWSYIISEAIFPNYECIVFHMTDLPYGRGGSPLQNLIVNGKKETMISALRVEKEVDAGPIYLKKPLSLQGAAQDIFHRSTDIIGEMIVDIIQRSPEPISQSGEPVYFKRRKPEESNLENIVDLETIYDYIRMLDAEGYPKAFLETEKIRVEFSNAQFNKESNKIEAHVSITKK